MDNFFQREHIRTPWTLPLSSFNITKKDASISESISSFSIDLLKI